MQGIETAEDSARISSNLKRVNDLMSDGRWHDAAQIREVGGSEGLRCFRQMRERHQWEKKHIGYGLWAYRIVAGE